MSSMEKKKTYISVGRKIFLYVVLTVFLVALSVAIVSHFINASRIDNYFKGLSLDTARNFRTFVDADFLQDVKAVVTTDEYQALREKAEEEENEDLIEEYLRDKGLWEDYVKNREVLHEYLENMNDVKYLYIVVWGDQDALYDMYLMDDYDNPLYYSCGYYEEREEAFLGMEATEEVAPTISNGDWGWLCSSYVPVHSEAGILVCQVGCDVGMDEIMVERRQNLLYILLVAVAAATVISIGVMLLIRKTISRPLSMITAEMKKFSPSNTRDYEGSGVMNLNIHSHDEMEDIHNEIRSMQIRIMEYLNDITTITKEKEQVENDVHEKEQEIGKISKEAYRDSLTSVGSKVAYAKKVGEINEAILQGEVNFGVVMVDVNRLKYINDKYGHAAGDDYLRGCCRIVCRIYKHSPVFRVGGDEFVVILTGEDYEMRKERMEELREAFETSYNREERDPWHRYSAAFGMAEHAIDDITFDLVFKRADKAMYEEKKHFKEAHGIPVSER